MAVRYEWVIETVDLDSEDIIDVDHADTYAEALLAAGRKAGDDDSTEVQVGLVRDDDGDRAWAYVKDGILPIDFSDAYGNPVGRVPLRYAAQVADAIAAGYPQNS